MRLVFYMIILVEKLRMDLNRKKKWRGGKTDEVPDEREK